MRGPSSRLKERRAQSRHHAFLMRKDNKAAIDSITDSVRELAELHSPAQGSCANQLSPMEKDRLLAWAESVDSLLNDFEPSENHNLDPVVRMLEKLQFLQDGHVCLAEVAADARALLEKWDRDNVFDASESSDDECATIAEDEEGSDPTAAEREDAASRSAAYHLGKSTLPRSYAYETVRQRAAANLIKRCVVRWARAQESFRDRVDEIALFGKTTSSLMEELTSTAGMRRPTDGASSDIFDLVKVKQSGMYAHSIGFNDLMQFSKHVGLFSVDHAIRRVEELEMKRYLYMARCALKMQTIWRKARTEFQARRMLKLVEELQLQREKQKQEERERSLLLGTNKDPPEASEGKRRSVLSSPKKSRAVSVSTPLTPESARASSRADEQRGSHSSTPQRASAVGVAKRKESSMKASVGSGVASAQEKRKRLIRGKSIKARSRFDDDDGDTTDVENAWQAFLDSAAQADIHGEMESGGGGADLIPTEDATHDGGDVISRVVMPEFNDNDWRNWSDDEEESDTLSSREANEKLALRLSLAVSTALPPTPATETNSGTTDPGFVDAQLNEAPGRSLSVNSAQGAGLAAQFPMPALHGFHFDDSTDRFRAKKTRVGTVSRMVPFAEFETSAPSTLESSVSAVRGKPRTQALQRLQELEFGIPDTKLALLQLADPLVKADDSETNELAGESIDGSNALRAVRVRQKDSTRKRRVDIVRHSIAGRDTEIFTYPGKDKRQQHQRYSPYDDLMNTSPPKLSTRTDGEGGTADSTREMFVYPIQRTWVIAFVDTV